MRVKQHPAGIGHGVADVAADDRVHRETGEQRVGQQQRVLKRDQRERAGELPGVGTKYRFQGGGRILLADAAGGGRRIVGVFHRDAWRGRRQGRGWMPAISPVMPSIGSRLERAWRDDGDRVEKTAVFSGWRGSRQAGPLPELQRRACTGQRSSNELPPRSVARQRAVP
ncbi:hypothetical protein G6F46_013664 [Rhizopus delemar]|nr:hypothetical protein G6F46_013664 [Rhizopus delemar]